jgi:membrane AbrB-like protein
VNGARRVSPALRWTVIAAATLVAAEGGTRIGAPTPFLFAAFAVGITHALATRLPLAPPHGFSVVAQAVIGWTAGAYFTHATVATVAAHGVAILTFCVLTVVLSIGAGLILARITPLDQATSSFGMIAGGAAGIISISRELGADERLVAVLQYVRLLIIVVLTPIVATLVYGISRTPVAAAHSPHVGLGIATFVVVGLGIAVPAGRFARLPASAIIAPMIAAASLSLTVGSLVGPLPRVIASLALAIIGLDVGLRFTPEIVREAGSMLPSAIAIILAMTAASAAFGVGLAYLTNTSQLDGYLATTPGGLSAVVALAIGSRTNIGFIVSVQVLRTFMMLLAAPPLARWLGARDSARAAAQPREAT